MYSFCSLIVLGSCRCNIPNCDLPGLLVLCAYVISKESDQQFISTLRGARAFVFVLKFELSKGLGASTWLLRFVSGLFDLENNDFRKNTKRCYGSTRCHFAFSLCASEDSLLVLMVSLTGVLEWPNGLL